MVLGELILIFLLIAANGLLAGSEIAIVAIRKTRLKQLLDEGNKRAADVIALQEQPERFLATVQIGLTVVSATAAAFSGARLADRLEPIIEPFIGKEYAQEVALVGIVAAVSFLSIVLGELVPKSLALRSAESYAMLAARPLLGLSYIARPIVWFLTAVSNLLLKPFHDDTTFSETRHSAEELQQLVEEAGETGKVDKGAGEIASRALEFGDLVVADIMVPRNKIDAIPVTATPADIRRIFLEEGHSRMPVYQGNLDNIVGYITSKDVLGVLWEEELIKIQDIIRPAFFVPETASASQILQDFKRRRTRMAIVVDEHGVVAGLITLEDLVEELVGELFSEGEEGEELFMKEGTAALVRGNAPIRDLNRALEIELPEGEAWTTIAGLVSTLAGRIPQPGTKLSLDNGTLLEVVDASPRQVRLVRLIPPTVPAVPDVRAE